MTQQDTNAIDEAGGWQPMCPLCGRLGYGWHEGTTACETHYFASLPLNPYGIYIEKVKEEITEGKQDRIKVL